MSQDKSSQDGSDAGPVPQHDGSQSPRRGRTPVVGIGASAGGFDPIRQLIESLPADSGLAFVIIQHLDPRRESHMADLLRHHCRLPVTVITQATRIEPDHVYTVPSDRYVGIRGDHFVLCEPLTEDGRRMPINYFFTSMAEQRGQFGIGVILSGSGNDGTTGARAIRRCEGLVIAQDPEEAQFADMPEAAAATGMVDRVLAVSDIPQAIDDYVRAMAFDEPPDEPRKISAEQVSDILGQIIAHTRCDFRNYKKNTIQRRILRRMGLCRKRDAGAYLDYLRGNPDEVSRLRNDMLIGVTGFFREPKAFDRLRDVVIAPLVDRCGDDRPIRIWVPGCATGEEVYSISMVLHGELEREGKSCPVHIFASDIDESALNRARHGSYSAEGLEDVPPHLLRSCFTRSEGQVNVAPHIREPIIFSAQNLISDPPFSRLDLISCRNVLIYLEPEIQRKVVSLFAFALKPGGHLFLGRSDAIGGREDLFELIDKEGRIFRRRTSARPEVTDFPVVSQFESGDRTDTQPPGAVHVGRPISLTVVNQQVLLDHYGAVVVLVDRL